MHSTTAATTPTMMPTILPVLLLLPARRLSGLAACTVWCSCGGMGTAWDQHLGQADSLDGVPLSVQCPLAEQ